MRSLAGGLVALGLVQSVVVIVIAVVIAWFTIPAPPDAGIAPPGAGPGPPDPSGPPLGALLTLACIPLVTIVGSLATARWLVPPLRRLRETADAVASGDLDARNHSDRPDELGAVARAFDGMTEQVGHLLRAERTLVATVSHELRTPLARVRVALELLEDDAGDALRAALADVRGDLSEVETLLDDVFAASRLDAASSSTAALNERMGTVAPEGIAASALARVRDRAPERVFLFIDERVEPHDVHVHVVLMRRALENLLANAHQHSPDPATPVTLRLFGEGADVGFAVEDQGTGIPPALRERLFAPFVRAPDAAAGREGLGLGLVLVKRIVDAHGGVIEVASRAGAGTTIELRIPRAG